MVVCSAARPPIEGVGSFTLALCNDQFAPSRGELQQDYTNAMGTRPGEFCTSLADRNLGRGGFLCLHTSCQGK